MRVDWLALAQGQTPAEDRTVEIVGWPVMADGEGESRRFLLVAEPACCIGCLPSHPLASLEVETTTPLAAGAGRLWLRGRWASRIDEQGVRRWRLREADVLNLHGGPGRRAVLGGALICTALPAAAQAPAQRSELASRPTIDVHSHAGRILAVNQAGAFTPIAEPMRRGSMSAICLAMVADSPTIKLEGGRLRPSRDPRPGELYEHAQKAFTRLHNVVREQGLAIVRDAASLPTPAMNRPSVIVSAEGADFLEGKLERLDEMQSRWQLRHLQLTHYRPNELGDIQTEPAVHNDLTAFGVEVVRRCNRLGIVVDVAHATLAMVRKAASVTAKPLVLSHSSLTERPAAWTRRILPEHARLIAQTRGVIGIWPVSEFFPTIAAYAEGMARMADVVGVAHVGLGSDMLGLVGASIFPDYDSLPELHAALRKRFNVDETAGILGGNYARVFAETVRG